jgi:hypothetical protein
VVTVHELQQADPWRRGAPAGAGTALIFLLIGVSILTIDCAPGLPEDVHGSANAGGQLCRRSGAVIV